MRTYIEEIDEMKAKEDCPKMRLTRCLEMLEPRAGRGSRRAEMVVAG